MTELLSPNRMYGVRVLRRFAAGHAVQVVTVAGAERWQVVFPGQRPAVFAAEAEAVGYADQVQREADRRQRR